MAAGHINCSWMAPPEPLCRPSVQKTSCCVTSGFFPFATNQPEDILVIGPGGGLDVWFGLFVEAQSIRAVEVNPASVDLVRGYAEYNGGLYDQPSVEVLVDEGRSILERDDRQYDLIFLSQVITETSERGGYALTENTVYTVEAFETYLDHLTRDGQIALKLYDELTLTRALSIAIKTFNARGLSDAEALQHIAAYTDPATRLPLLVIQRAAFSEDDSLALGAVANQVGFEPLFLPGVIANPPLDAVVSGERSYADIVAESEADISAPTDDRPFFFQFERGLPGTLRELLWASAAILLLGGGLDDLAWAFCRR